MDALDRLEPVARDLLRQVDESLTRRGAPADHPVWTLLRRVGATPADAIAFVAGQRPGELRHLGDVIRGPAGDYVTASIPATLDWAGSAADAYGVRAAALAAHLRGGGADSMTGRLAATAGYLDAVADWQQRSRDHLARALADILTSGQAVTLRLGQAGRLDQAGLLDQDGRLEQDGRLGGAGAEGPVVTAAADIGARVLAAAAEALDTGTDLGSVWADRLTEVSYVEHAGPTPTLAARIDVRH
jgi:hypothetical protein